MAHGILLLDKPLGLSSNGALQRVRRAYGASRAGHVGSLDPLATGMLPICLGEATKIAGEVLSGRKHYTFTVTLGARTATGDAEGDVVETAPVPAVDTDAVHTAVAGFVGRGRQIPPMYSALKRDGQPLYRLARAGVEVERPARDIDIHEAVVQRVALPEIEIAIECSKGTYVRVLAEDIARALGTCGHVTALRRDWVEPFEAAPMVSLDTVLDGAVRGELPALMPVAAGLPHWPAVNLGDAGVARLRQGQTAQASAPGPVDGAKVLCFGPDGQIVALGLLGADGYVQPRRVFNL